MLRTVPGMWEVLLRCQQVIRTLGTDWTLAPAPAEGLCPALSAHEGSAAPGVIQRSCFQSVGLFASSLVCPSWYIVGLPDPRARQGRGRWLSWEEKREMGVVCLHSLRDRPLSSRRA